MPYLKFARDKKGYENFYLFEPPSNRHNQTRPRLLYWFRSPPHVKVGREPFAEEVRRAIEAQNPDLKFDWARLMATPIPPADAQNWRERRRLERAARQASRETADEVTDSVEAPPVIEAGEQRADSLDPANVAVDEGVAAETSSAASDGVTSPSQGRRRRRRRRGRRPGQPQQDGAAAPAPSSEPPPPPEEV